MMRARFHDFHRIKIRSPRADPSQVLEVESTSSPVPSNATTNPTVNVGLITSKVAIIGAVSVFVAIIIVLIIIWKMRQRKLLKEKNASFWAERVSNKKPKKEEKFKVDLEKSAAESLEKASKAIVLASDANDTSVGWVPQIKSEQRVAMPAVPQPAAQTHKILKAKPHWVETNPLYTGNMARSPPPSYQFVSISNTSSTLIPIPPTPPDERVKLTPTPPTPPVNKKFHNSLAASEAEPPLPSPARSESFAATDISIPSSNDSDCSGSDYGHSSSHEGQRLPRLMTVSATFRPSLDDELAIKVGDTVRMIEEYRDGWCFVQYVGLMNAPRGVVPRFCLQERRNIVPYVPSHKSSIGSLNSNRR